MSDYLPQDVVANILSRLPVKPLLRFSCVSKTWNCLIKSPSFIKIHLNRAKSDKSRQKLLLTRYMFSSTLNEQFSLHFDDAAFNEYASFKCPFEANLFFKVVGVCNGLICLSEDYCSVTYNLIIWNPATRRFLKLPTPSSYFDLRGLAMCALGFGYDVRKDEYKVVKLSFILQRDGVFAAPPKFEIFSVGTGSWRTIDLSVPSCAIFQPIWSLIFLNGSVHWSGFSRDSKGCQNVVLSFDMVDEMFGIVELPEPYDKSDPMNFSIGLCVDSLALFVYDDPVNSSWFAVYVMKEYGVVESWSELYRVELNRITVLGFRENGEILVETKDNELACYEPNCKQMKNLGISGYRGLYTAAYEESLALLNEENLGLC